MGGPYADEAAGLASDEQQVLVDQRPNRHLQTSLSQIVAVGDKAFIYFQ